VEDYFWRVYCDNYVEMAKSRTYDETLTPERLSACATLRLTHRALLRLFAPFVPYITDEVWHWAYSEDAGMNSFVHKSPWPTLDEFSNIPAPQHANTYDATVAAADAVRKAKADANVSMAAPVQQANFTVVASAVPAVEATLDDIQRMLKIESVTVKAGEVENAMVSVEAVIVPPTEA
jgi:valyl-tRNA synthetase